MLEIKSPHLTWVGPIYLNWSKFFMLKAYGGSD